MPDTKDTKDTKAQLLEENHRLRAQLDAMVCTEHDAARPRDAFREDRYRAILDGITEGYYEVDLAGNLTFFNSAMCRMLNQPPSKMVGMNFRSYLSEGDARNVHEVFRRVFRTGEPEKGFDYELIQKDGSRVSIAVSVSLIRDADGRPSGFRGLARDISARKRTEEALRKSEQKFRLIVENIRDIYFRCDLEGNLVMVSRSALIKLGYESFDEIIDRPVLSLYLDPSQREQYLHTLRAQGYVDDFWIRIRKKDGTPVDGSVSSSFCYDEHGNPVGMEGIIRDITERMRMEEKLRRSEERYRLMADNIRDLIWTMDLRMNLDYVSPSMRTMYGYTPEEAKGFRFEKLLTPDAVQKVLALYRVIKGLMAQGTLSGKGFSETLVLEHVRKDGSTFWGETQVSITVDDDGQIVGLQAVTRDITERKRAEILVKDKEAAEIANRAKSEFLARMSHEIRTPLNGIIGMTELCLGQDPDENIKGLLQTLYGEARSLSGLIDDILDLAKIEAGKMVLGTCPFDLADLIRTVEEGFAPRARQKGLHFETYLAPDIPVNLVGDPVRLRQVLVNLIGNALKFTPAGGVSVSGELVRDAGGAVTVMVSVSDTGIGIPPDRQQRIFEAFEQADGSTTRQYGGTGLGIAIAKEIVRMMGGEIGVVSEPGEGSTFWFTAELQKGAEREAARGQEVGERPAAPVAGTLAPRQGRRILLVDDYAVNLEVARRHLEAGGHAVALARNGREAIDAFRSGGYEIIFMDIQMPVMDGIEATRAIRALENGCGTATRIPIVALTAHAVREYIDACLQAGMDDYLIKPVFRQNLLDKVARWTDGDGSAASRAAADREPAASPPVPAEPMDFARALEEFDGNREFLVGLLERFLENVRAQLGTIREALDRADADILRREAHAIKGGAANLAAAELSSAAAELEKTAKSGSLEEALGGVARLETAYRRLDEFIRKT
ncbi:MAG: PAS domain S-box protein [Syntrophales bacterium]|nr:PAS domain S-box protein [Syntrophales bacterium]